MYCGNPGYATKKGHDICKVGTQKTFSYVINALVLFSNYVFCTFC
jgi:hypothetical protein